MLIGISKQIQILGYEDTPESPDCLLDTVENMFMYRSCESHILSHHKYTIQIPELLSD